MCLILVLFSLLIFGAKQLSLTSDEPPHIAHGYVMLKTGETWALVDHRHPPLSNMLSASLLLLQPEQPDPTQIKAWAEDFVLFVRALWPQLGPIERLAYITRYPNILLSLILLSLVIRWTREISHHTAAIIAAVLMILDPTMVAHAQLNTTDISLTLLAFMTMYLIRKVTNKTKLINYAVVGAAVGAAMATKASGLLLVPVVFGFLLWQLIQPVIADRSSSRDGYKLVLLKFISAATVLTLAALICIAVIYAIPGIFSTNLNLASSLGSHIDLILTTLSERHRSAFLAGEIRQGGWWWYFPFAFVIKTPIPSIILISFTVLFAMRQPATLIKRMAVWLFPITYLIFSIRSNLNIGYRHLLPIFPFVYIAVGRALGILTNHQSCLTPPFRFADKTNSPLNRIVKLVIVLLLIWQAVDMALIFPYPIAYFNVFAGGPENGYRYLVDSNVDWGQSFLALKKYMQTEEIPWTWLSYYTWIDPTSYGINFQPLPPNNGQNTIPRRFNPAPGVYTISATTLQGVMVADPSMYDWFRHQKPISQPGYGLMVYQVEPKDKQPGWVAQCSAPTPPLSPQDIASGFGLDDLRIVTFDCENAWIFPENGESSGWYILHKDITNKKDDFINISLGYSRLSYQQSEPGILPAFVIYEKESDVLPTAHTIHEVFGEHQLILIGYSLPNATPSLDETIDVITLWSIRELPNRPLSLMLHVSHTQTGDTFVGDGLGVPVTEWREGDIIMQRHRLSFSQDSAKGTYNVIAGVYWLDTLERWIPVNTPDSQNNAVLVSQIEIK